MTVTLAGLAAIEKSWKTNVTVVEFVVDPLVAVTVATEVTAAALVQAKVEVPLVPRAMLLGVKVHEAPFVAATVRATVPVKVPRAATVIVEEPPGAPTFALTLVGLAEMLIPPPPVIVTLTLVELVIALFVPPVPVKVRV